MLGTNLLENANTLINSWKTDPQKFTQDAFGYSEEALGRPAHWDGELAILEGAVLALQERKPLVIASGHALGKDYTSSELALWFLNAFGDKSCKVIVTGPTDRQVKEIMWTEIKSRWQDRKIELPGRLITCKIDIEPDWFMLGFTTTETNEMVGKFQGFHAESICVIVTEAQAVKDSIWEQLDGILTSENSLLVAIGNPLRITGRYAKMIKDTTNNIVIRLDCEKNPNYINKKTIIPGLCSYEWVERNEDKI